MNNEEFRNSIYKKYNYYKDIKDDDFYNKRHYKKKNDNIVLNKIAIFFVTIILTASVVYASNMIYKLYMQKTSKGTYTDDLDSWFEIGTDDIYYKKISDYKEYLVYKEKWNNLIDMSEEDFKENFLIAVLGNWRTPGIYISNVYVENDILYIEVDEKMNEEEIDKKEYMVSATVSKELERELVIVKKSLRQIKPDLFQKLENLPKEYSIEQAENDGCIIIENTEIKDIHKEKINSFISNTQNKLEDHIRIYRTIFDSKLNEESIIIQDIQYSNGEYILYTDTTRNNTGIKQISYIGYFQNIELIKEENEDDIFYGLTKLYLNNLVGSRVLITIYK